MAKTRSFTLAFARQQNFPAKIYLKILIFLSVAAFAALTVPAANAQLQQPLVFSSSGAVAVRNDQTGALTGVVGSPFPAANQSLTLDVQGRYLFAIGTNSIRMFAITNSTTGAYQEVPSSPFASPSTNQPAFIAVEPTGQYIAVVNRVGQNPGDGMVETFLIAPTVPGGPALVPVQGSPTELDSTPVGAAQPLDNKSFLLFLGLNAESPISNLIQGSEFQQLSIGPQTGFIAGFQQNASLSQRGDSFAMDPQGRYYVTGTQDNLLEFGIVQLLGLDGDNLQGNIQMPQFNFPVGLWIDSTGTFLYVATSDLQNPVVVNIYSVDLQTGQLTKTASSPLPNFASVPPYFADPTGSFNYGFGADANTAIAYTVDPQTGYFVQSTNSPFTIPQISGSLTFSIPPGQQGISGPSASLSATSLSFGSLQTGITSMPQTITLTSNGAEGLSVNSISLSGADASQFLESDTCQVPSVLAPNKFCSISITFKPTNTGSQQATLTITDTAPGGAQTVQLSGAGIAPPPPAPAVTITPNPVSFATITQGITSNPIVVTVKNSGNATLNISSVSIGGNNVGDFATTMSGCAGAIAPQGTCTITVTFAPIAAGQRTETVTINDDAPDSPQVLNIGGNANPAATLGAAPAGSTSATVSAGQSAQYSLQITPGAGYTGNVSLAYSGAPAGASVQGPSTLQITNGSAAQFMVTVTTSGGASGALPFCSRPNAKPFLNLRMAPGLTAAITLLLLLVFRFRLNTIPRPKLETCFDTLRGATFVVVLLLTIGSAGCGGGIYSPPPPPPKVVTPQGTSTITINPSAMSASGKQMQLQPIQLTLTVN